MLICEVSIYVVCVCGVDTWFVWMCVCGGCVYIVYTDGICGVWCDVCVCRLVCVC